MTGAEYAQIAASIQAKIAEIITGVVTTADSPPVVLAKVLTEDPFDLDVAQWEGGLLSDTDLDTGGSKRIHAWLVTFAGSDGAPSKAVRSIEPTLSFRVQAWLRHEQGSAAIFLAETLKVQWEIAKAAKLNLPGVVTRHKGLPIECRRLGKFSKTTVHRSDTVIEVQVEPRHLG
jgi:hypothetical protein